MSMDTGWAYRVAAPHRFERVQDRPPPPLRRGEILVELTAGAVCGSDLPFARGAMVPAAGAGLPGRPLHEVVGVVIATEHADFCAGDRVVGWASQWDALRQRFVTAGDQVAKVRMPGIDAHVTVAQSVACLMTVFDRLGPLAGRSVAIVGVGPFGLMASALAHHHGAGRIVGVDPVDRAKDAVGLPFDALVRDTARGWSRDIAEGDRPDVVLEMVGHQTSTLADAMSAITTGGTVVAFGVPDDDWYALPLREFFRRNGTLVTGVTRDHRAMLERAQDYLTAHAMLAQHMVTNVYPIDQVERAFEVAMRPRPDQRKVVLEVG
ncbi:zinc-binding dehydrogenase [Demequina activiva]|uniref:Alcohol dehydrogenase n=1 Tax=Demequina activiva TaxID=1582364 RepID=A0A919Q5I9_9MICO|nr:zinc-binding dehydrogenase [Demequina activiva]GIG54908.1 alcohol dehydrogenase [Demequina activiva]